MKSCFSENKRIFIFLGLLIFLSGLQIYSQKNICRNSGELSLNDILTLLKLASQNDKSKEKINEELQKAVLERKVLFELTAESEKSLKNAGANDLLLQKIRENYPAEIRRIVTIYDIFVTTYESSNIEQTKIALGAAKAFVDNYKKNECLKEHVNYFKDAVPFLKEKLNYLEYQVKQSEKLRELRRLDNAFRSKNYIEFFDIAAEVLKAEPDFLDLILVLASIGYDQAKVQGSNSKLNDKTIRYAELAVKLLKSGKESEYKDYGNYKYEYKTKTNALNKMNEIVEYMRNQKLN